MSITAAYIQFLQGRDPPALTCPHKSSSRAAVEQQQSVVEQLKAAVRQKPDRLLQKSKPMPPYDDHTVLYSFHISRFFPCNSF